MLNGGAVRAAGALAESGHLVSPIGDVALRALLKEVDLSNNRALVEQMVEGRRRKVFSDIILGIKTHKLEL